METQAVYWDRDDQRYRVEPELHRRIFRHYQLTGRVSAIVSKLGHSDCETYLKRWLAKFNADGKCPAAHVWDGGDGYSALLARIGAIEAILLPYSNAPIPEDHCGLPLSDWISRVVQKQEARRLANQVEIEKQQNNRRTKLIDEARSELKDEAGDWLETARTLTQAPLLEWGSENDEQYWKAVALIEKAGSERRVQKAAQIMEEGRQKRLISAAEAALRDAERAQLFVRSAHPKLDGRRPIECCGTDADLNRVLQLLPLGR